MIVHSLKETIYSNWLPMDKSQTPRPRPGECRRDLGANDTLQLSESSMNFIKRHSLMDWAVQASRRVGLGVPVRCTP